MVNLIRSKVMQRIVRLAVQPAARRLNAGRLLKGVGNSLFRQMAAFLLLKLCLGGKDYRTRLMVYRVFY